MRFLLPILLTGCVLQAQAIPDRPEKLTFRQLSYKAPRAAEHKVQLKNGIPVYLAEDPQSSFLRIRIGIRGGAFLDPVGKEGLARLLGLHLRQGGTRSLPAVEFDRSLDRMAAKMETSAGYATVELRLQVMLKDAEVGVGLLLQALMEPAFEEARLDLGRKQLLSDLEKTNEDVGRLAEAHMGSLLYGDDRPRPTLSTLAGIRREDLVAFHARILHPGNLVVSVSGGMNRRSLQDLLEQRLGKLCPGPTGQRSPAIPTPRFKRKAALNLIQREVTQSVVRLALPGPRRSDPDWESAFAMNEILGARLTAKIRVEQGLTYGIRCSLDEGAFGQGDWLCTFRTKNPSVARALRLVLAEIETLKNAPMAEAELEAVKEGIIQAYPAKWSNRQYRVDTFASDLLLGWGEDHDLDYRARIVAVTLADVQKAARDYLDVSRLVVLVVGNLAEVEAGERTNTSVALKDVLPLTIHRLNNPDSH